MNNCYRILGWVPLVTNALAYCAINFYKTGLLTDLSISFKHDLEK